MVISLILYDQQTGTIFCVIFQNVSVIQRFERCTIQVVTIFKGTAIQII